MKDSIRNLRNFARKRWAKLRSELRLLVAPTVHVSLGENCLTDNVLERHGVKSFTTPYSHARSNLDYALQLEASDYRDLLSPDALVYEQAGGLKVVRNRRGFHCDAIYLDSHSNGFEFTHHDVIASKRQHASYLRKIKRLLRYKGKKNFCFYYHYRVCERQDIARLILKLVQLQQRYAIHGRFCHINVFTQQIVSAREQRGLVVEEPKPGIRVFHLRTLSVWGGDVDDDVWARGDDDLLAEMLSQGRSWLA